MAAEMLTRIEVLILRHFKKEADHTSLPATKVVLSTYLSPKGYGICMVEVINGGTETSGAPWGWSPTLLYVVPTCKTRETSRQWRFNSPVTYYRERDGIGVVKRGSFTVGRRL